MGDNGGTTEMTLTCGRDGAATRLRCAECQAPICPACFVRTPVGLRCPDCAVASGPPAREYEAETRPRWLAPAVVAAAVAIALAGAVWLGSRSEGGPALNTEIAQAPKPVRIGAGNLTRGGWVLDARRGDGICATLTLLPGVPGNETCRPLPGDRHLAFTSTRLLAAPSETVYLTWGLVSERTERVLVAPEGQAPWEVPALGAGENLGGRFFVAQTTSPITTFTALAADGAPLASIRSAPPGS